MNFTRLSTTLLILALSAPALAQGLAERRYDPPAGSKWSIVSESESVENRAKGERRDQRVNMKSELTIDEKLPDGFRVSYVNRSIDVTGSAPAVKLMGDAYSAMTNVVIRGRLDSAGRPVAVENLDEVKAAMRVVVDKMVAKFESNPKAAEFMREMMGGMLNLTGRDAATTYMDELPQLAVVQNAGIRPDNPRRDIDTTPSPFGGVTFKTIQTTRLDSFDEKTGKARYIRKREFEKESLREAVLSIVRRLAPIGDNKTITPEMIEMMKQIDFSIEAEAVYDTENGMTMRIDDREFTRASAMGTSFTKQQKKVVTVTRVN